MAALSSVLVSSDTNLVLCYFHEILTFIFRLSTLNKDLRSLFDPSMSVWEIFANPPSIPSIVVGTEAQ